MARAGFTPLAITLFIVLNAKANADIQLFYENGTLVDSTETVVETGSNLILKCQSDEPINWITPQINDSETSTVIRVEEDTSSQKPSKKLIIENITYKFTGYYTCNEQRGHKSINFYIYVHDEEHLAVNDDFIVSISGEVGSDVTFPCRPTSPDIPVDIYIDSSGDVSASFDPKIGFIHQIDAVEQSGSYTCSYGAEADFEQTIYLTVDKAANVLSVPIIEEVNEKHNIIGEPLTLLCKSPNKNVTLTWTPPGGLIDQDRVRITVEQDNNYTISTLRITTTTLLDKGAYKCTARNQKGATNHFSLDIQLYDKNENFLEVEQEHGQRVISINASFPGQVRWSLKVRGHPHPSVSWLNNRNESIGRNMGKYVTNFTTMHASLKINDVTLADYGNYTIVAKNMYQTKYLPLLLNVTDKPQVKLSQLSEFNLLNSEAVLKCTVLANPEPDIVWEFTSCDTCSFQPLKETDRHQKGIKYLSIVRMRTQESGWIKCTARNQLGQSSDIAKFQVSDVRNGFDIYDMEPGMNYANGNAEVAAGGTITMTCGYSSPNKSGVHWYRNNSLIQVDENQTVEDSITNYSAKSKLTILNASYEKHQGLYACKSTDSVKTKLVQVHVQEAEKPHFAHKKEEIVAVNIGQEMVMLTCNVYGLPKPSVRWYKDSKLFQPQNDRIMVEESGKNITFRRIDLKDEGTYKCEAENSVGSAEKVVSVAFKNKPGTNTYLYIIIVVIVLILLVLIVVLCVHIRRSKKLQKELKLAGLANFEKGATEQINPELGADEQADLLPYDKKWEFPFEDLKLGKQLGAGAFGVVVRAEAKNIVPNEDSTTVAVKMVRKNTDHMYIKALASELKIMVHLGQHLNVVNLLGACTKNVAKKELMVIVEYCKYGNLQNYLLRQRNKFIDQLDHDTGLIDFTIGEELMDRPQSINSYRNSQSTTAPNSNSKSDYRGDSVFYNTQTGATEMTNISVNSAGYVDRKMSRLNSEQPHWRSNYKGDYKEHGPPVCTKSLLVWSFQIARGMEYLASRKILHGDLAARNVLLCENNIVKICDFGLARNVYKSENYKKKSDGPLPIKWMAIESIGDKIFSTQSDVWSFGITLWEIFSLSKTPYPGMEADERLYYKLLNNYRMECPEYAPAKIYEIMMDCWNGRAIDRPTFTELEMQLGKFLEDTTKEHYVTLNEPYLAMNDSRQGQNDYLAMMSSPSFLNLSSPTQSELPEGYLTPLSVHLELTPMLHSVVHSESDSDTPLQSPTCVANPSYEQLNVDAQRHYVNDGILV